MRFDDLPIRLKLPLTIGAGLFLFAGVVLFYTLTLRQTIGGYEHLLDFDLGIQQAAQDITVEMLQARRAEKDFLARRDPALLEVVNQHVARAGQAAETIRRLSAGTLLESEVESRMRLVDHLERYRKWLMEVAVDLRAKGLNHREGRQGEFRVAAHAMEDAMQRIDRGGERGDGDAVARLEAMVDYLSMRRMEKDYLLGYGESLAGEVDKYASGLAERLKRVVSAPEERKQLEALLGDYRTAFHALVALDQGIEEKMVRLREEIHHVEPLAEQIEALAVRHAASGSKETRKMAERSAQWIFLASLLTIFACGLLSMRLVRRLVRSISALSRYAREVAEGNLDATTTLASRDEIGHLALVMREMVNRMRAIRLIADRLVVIMALLGRGAIPEPLEVEFHGDFKKITDALNDLIGRLQVLRRIAACIDAISQGDVPEKMSGDFQGDFKRINDAMNVMIDKVQEIGGLSVSVP
ncbi:MAG: HAMP domain-containing protein [Magnetococcales bacterium]|nr:HAMP domain-containing protein [Magnetococcales bacterium]